MEQGEKIIDESKEGSTEELLDAASLLTSMMREHQNAISRLSERRRDVLKALRERNVKVKEIAAKMSVSEQAVFAELRKDK